MEQYIPKSALVAEITKIYDRNRSNGFIDVCDEIDDILSFIDTLEVKEVDLEKEIKESIIDEWCNEWSGDVGNWIRYRRGTTSMTIEDVKDIAKHFFELGLKAQKGE